ncbi:fimbrial biogenesis chaperone [Lysobacter sp. CA199]|uniref:fimbrial biogenesis chaperone n=1 Tax=Lysobacter sp. CA199 TaxID=3455608 RepID=UPI003F8D8525
MIRGRLHRAVRAAPAGFALCAVLALAQLLAPATAAGLQVTPTSLTLQARQQADGLWLNNTGDTLLRAQVRVFRWVQEDGSERFEPSQGLAISPPMIELAPGARQLVRVIRLGAPPAGETAYRLIVDELPLEQTAQTSGLQFVLRYSVPVFVAPAGDPSIRPELSAQLSFEGDTPWLAVGNRGGQHAQLADLTFIDAQGSRHPIAPGLLGYALPGQRMRWALKAPAALLRGPGTFKARINGESDEQALALDPPAR